MKFYKVKIGDIWLTDTGLETGDQCKLEISNVEDLMTTVSGVAIPSASGVPIFQMMPWTSGKQFEIRINVVNLQVYNDLKTLLLASLESLESFEVVATGDTGNFTVNALPFPNKPYSAQRFKNGRIYAVVLRLITV